MNQPGDAEARARSRFFAIGMLRLGGAVVTMLGLLILAGRIAAPDLAGYLLLVVGLVDFFVVPVLLARRWRS